MPRSSRCIRWASRASHGSRSGRTSSLAFALGSIYAHLRALDAPRHRVVGLHVASFALYVCALLAKTTAVFVAPALVLIALHRNDRWSAKRVAALAPYFAVGLALGLFTAYLERVQVGRASCRERV